MVMCNVSFFDISVTLDFDLEIVSELILDFSNVDRALRVVHCKFAVSCFCHIVEAILKCNFCFHNSRIVTVVLLNLASDLLLKFSPLHWTMSHIDFSLGLWFVFKACAHKTDFNFVLNLGLWVFADALILIV